MSSINIENIENTSSEVLMAYSRLLEEIAFSRLSFPPQETIFTDLNGKDIDHERKPKITKKSLKAKKKDLIASADEVVGKKKRGRPKAIKVTK